MKNTEGGPGQHRGQPVLRLNHICNSLTVVGDAPKVFFLLPCHLACVLLSMLISLPRGPLEKSLLYFSKHACFIFCVFDSFSGKAEDFPSISSLFPFALKLC